MGRGDQGLGMLGAGWLAAGAAAGPAFLMAWPAFSYQEPSRRLENLRSFQTRDVSVLCTLTLRSASSFLRWGLPRKWSCKVSLQLNDMPQTSHRHDIVARKTLWMGEGWGPSSQRWLFDSNY